MGFPPNIFGVLQSHDFYHEYYHHGIWFCKYLILLMYRNDTCWREFLENPTYRHSPSNTISFFFFGLTHNEKIFLLKEHHIQNTDTCRTCLQDGVPVMVPNLQWRDDAARARGHAFDEEAGAARAAWPAQDSSWSVGQSFVWSSRSKVSWQNLPIEQSNSTVHVQYLASSHHG